VDRAVAELARVLERGGLLLATRDHVAEDDDELAAFRTRHPLHAAYGGENAFPVRRYREAVGNAGLRIVQAWGPYDSILNYYPGTERARRRLARRLAFRLWFGAGLLLSWSRQVQDLAAQRASARDRVPGRLFSLLAVKP
jgi:hypothetical protein